MESKLRAMSDPRVEAVRADELVGLGSCTSMDEAFTDAELIAHLDGMDVSTPAGAIKEARDMEELWLEQGLNARWGEDDDPQKVAYDSFIKRRKELER